MSDAEDGPEGHTSVDKARCEGIQLENGYIIYDRNKTDAWVQSNHTVDTAQHQ